MMEGSDVRASRSRALLFLAALALLLVAVAVASTGAVPVGSAGTRRSSERFIDVMISLYLLLMVVGVGLWVYVFVAGKNAVAEAIAARHGRSGWPSLVRVLLGLGLAGLVFFSIDDGLRRRLERILAQSGGPDGSNGAQPTGTVDYQPQFATGPVLVVLTLFAIAGAAWYLSHRARRRVLEPVSEALLPALADMLEETLDDLRAETDPRRAVIAAYARMERALAAYGLPRGAAEAPDEYLQRIFSDLEVSRRATSRLTALFAWAKFSSHDVAPEMKLEAIEALEAVHAELRAAEILAEERRIAAMTELRERAAH